MGEEMSKRKDWTTVAIPKSLHATIKSITEAEKKPIWSVIEQAVGMYYAQLKQPRIKESLSIIDKMAWYIIKASMSVGSLKAEPTQENLSRLQKTISTIEARLNLSTKVTDLLLKTARQYVELASTADKDELNRLKSDINMALKMLVIEILSTEAQRLEEEEEL